MIFYHLNYQLYEENEKNTETIKNLRTSGQKTQAELDKANKLNGTLNECLDKLKSDLEVFKEKYNSNIEKKSNKIENDEEIIKNLEIELARAETKVDETNWHLNEIKMKYTNQLKSVNKNIFKFNTNL